MKAIILDMFGVILKQSGEEFYSYVQGTFPTLSEAEIYAVWDRADMGEISSLDVWRELGFQGDIEKREREFLDTLEINQGFYEFADKARTQQYRLAILSNDSSRWSRYIRDKFDLNQYFDVIHISGDLKMKKPDLRIFELTAQKLEVAAKDCIYVDDRRKNLAAAQTVGMDTVLFNTRGVAYEGKTVTQFWEMSELLGMLEAIPYFRGRL